jgi:Holliday junction DNA helicase RuvB
MGTHVTVTAGPALTKGGDLVGTLTKLQRGDVLFIDEVHRLPIAVEEFIYPAMEDYKIDFTIDSGMHAKTIPIELKPFTLIGATTRAGLVSGPMRSRFGITHNLEFYSDDDLLTILQRNAELLQVGGTEADAALLNIAKRSRGTPRIANRLLRRARDFAQVKGDGKLTAKLVDQALKLEGVDALGLDALDRKYLKVIGETYRGGPVGLEAVAATLSEDAGTLESMVEPFLLQLGFLARTRKGRQLTRDGANHVGVRLQASPDQLENEPSKAELF